MSQSTVVCADAGVSETAVMPSAGNAEAGQLQDLPPADIESNLSLDRAIDFAMLLH